MFQIGFACAASVALAGSAMAGIKTEPSYIDGGEAKFIGTFTGAQLAAMQGPARRDTNMYSTNWSTDSAGASFTAGNIASATSALGQGNWAYYCGSEIGRAHV